MIFFSLNWKVKIFEGPCDNRSKFQEQLNLCVSNIEEKVYAHHVRAVSSWLTRWLCKRTLTAFNTCEGWDSKPWPELSWPPARFPITGPILPDLLWVSCPALLAWCLQTFSQWWGCLLTVGSGVLLDSDFCCRCLLLSYRGWNEVVSDIGCSHVPGAQDCVSPCRSDGNIVMGTSVAFS